jgi:hypothetical protein
MIRSKNLWLVLGLVAILSLGALAADPWTEMYNAGDATVWYFNNTNGETANILHLEFEQEVTLSSIIPFGGQLVAMGPLTGTTFDFYGSLIDGGTVQIYVTPATAVPALAQWLTTDALGNRAPLGTPYFTSINVLGRLFGIGIVAVREANPAALVGAFGQFFADNAEYLAGLSASLGMSLADSLMPIIMASPADGIENFFNTIMGMLGVTSLTEVVTGGVNWGALFAVLGI